MSAPKQPKGSRNCLQHGPGDMRVEGKKSPQWRCGICQRERLREMAIIKELARPVQSPTMEARMTLLYEVSFTCPHTNIFTHPSPRVGDVMHCNYCGEWKRVVKVAEGRRRHAKTKTRSVGKT